MTEEKQPTGSSSQITRTKLLTEIKDLRQVLSKETDNFKARSKQILSQGTSDTNQIRDQLKTGIMGIIDNHEKYTNEQLISLKESLEGQLDSLRGYATNLVEVDEQDLVNSLEASLTNVKDVSSAQREGLKQLYNKVNELASKSASKSIEIAKNRDQVIKEELTTQLELNKDELSSSINSLRDNFQDEMNQKIESVFMGVTMTKEGINGIIRDTLSRLEENLNRLTEGIDKNFTKEVGETQDLIHQYEGSLISAIEETQENYQKMMVAILDKHSSATNSSLDTLKKELDVFKKSILDEVGQINNEQSQLFNNATKQLETQIEKSRADVIESHGTLKDELEKLLQANKESLEETLQNLRNNSKKRTDELEKKLNSQVSASQDKFSDAVNKTKTDIDQISDNMANHIKQRTNKSESIVNQSGN